ncbi:MAG: ABC transporter permease [Caldilineaceae bacterium]|jgi:putative ABC transport system permease protein
MLVSRISNPLWQVSVQVAIAIVFTLVVVWLARRQRVHLEKETVIALVRGLVQVVLVGAVLVVLFKGPLWVGVPALVVMMGVAGWTAAQRVKGIPGALLVAALGITIGAGSVILLMTLLGAIEPRLEVLIPIGSMLIASAMNSCAQALERLHAEIEAHRGQVEAALALGAGSKETLEPYVQAAVHASMIPRIDSLRSLGIVWIPGLMAGMIVAGADPIYASLNQFVVIALLYAASVLTAMASTLFIRSHLFTEAEQLALPA